MKKFFAFAMAIVSMAAVMTSCNNDNAEFIEQKAPRAAASSQETGASKAVNTHFDGNIYFFAYEEQFDYINTEYDVQVGTETMTVNVENLQQVSNLPDFIEAKFDYNAKNIPTFVRPMVFVYQIPAGMKGDVTVFYNLSVKEAAKNVERVTLYCGGATNGSIIGSPMKGLMKFNEYVNSIKGNKVLSATLN